MPALYEGAVLNQESDFAVSTADLVSVLFRAGRQLPRNWEAILHAAIGHLAKIMIVPVQLPPKSWEPLLYYGRPAFPLLKVAGEQVRGRLDPDFVGFLAPCFPNVVAPAKKSPSKTQSAAITEHKMQPNAKPMVSEQGSLPAEPSTRPAPGKPSREVTAMQQQAAVMEYALPAMVLATIADKSVGKAVSQQGHLLYMNQLMANAGAI